MERREVWLAIGTLVGFAIVGVGFGNSGIGVILAALGVTIAVLLGGRAVRLSPSRVQAPSLRQAERSRGSETSLARELMPYAVMSLCLRFLVVGLVNGTDLWLTFAPDALTWGRRGEMVERLWLDPYIFVDGDRDGVWTLYPVINAIALRLFGTTRIPLSIANTFVGLYGAGLATVLAYRLFGRNAARRTFLLVAFYPSLLLWSAMNIRDVWAHAIILHLILIGTKVRERASPLSLVGLLAFLLLLYSTRPYLLALFVLALGVSLLIVRPRQLPFAAVALVVLGIFVNVYREQVGLLDTPIEAQLARIQELRIALAGGGSAYGSEADTSTIGRAIAYLPLGFVRFLFSPFPWDIHSFQQAMALPESMVFLVFVCQAAKTALRGMFADPSRIALPVSVVVILASAYSLVSGNEGTAFRHRAQVVVIVLAFTAAEQVRQRERNGQARMDWLERHARTPVSSPRVRA